MEAIVSFKQLNVWQDGIKLVEDVYRLTQSFPREESYGLVSQIRRAAVSVPANIAEGFKRFHTKEYIQFLRIALGSLAELETEMIIAVKLKYLSESDGENISHQIESISKRISSLVKKLGLNQK